MTNTIVQHFPPVEPDDSRQREIDAILAQYAAAGPDEAARQLYFKFMNVLPWDECCRLAHRSNTDDAQVVRWAYHPLDPGTKKGNVKGWQHTKPGAHQRTNCDGINLGGCEAGEYQICCFDYDLRKDPVPGKQLAELLEWYPALRSAPTVKTPGGGVHMYALAPPELKLKKNQLRFPAFDFLCGGKNGSGRNAVAPGSRTGAGEYVLAHPALNFDQLSLSCFPMVPPEIIGELETGTGEAIKLDIIKIDDSEETQQRGIDYLRSRGTIEKGSRDSSIIKYARELRDYGLSEDVTFSLTVQHLDCQPPLDADKIQIDVKNAYKNPENSQGCKHPDVVQAELMKVFDQCAPEHPPDSHSPGEAPTSKSKTTKSDEVAACAAELDLWWDGTEHGYATIFRGEHFEHYLIQSKAFKKWLEHSYFAQAKKIPTEATMKNALRSIDGRARFSGVVREPQLRVAEHGGKIYVDLCDDKWQAVEISEDGYRVIGNPPVRFVRGGNMLPLPVPEAAGTEALDELKALINFANEDSWTLLLAFLAGVFRANIAYLMCFINGGPGAGKSFLTQVIRGLTDPTLDPLLAPPDNEDQLMITARNNWVCSWENVSRINERMADNHCRLATGGSISRRELFTNFDDVTLRARRPQVMNGIPVVANREDLLQRSVLLSLAPVPDGKTQEEEKHLRAFEAIRPRVLGALFSALSGALKRRHEGEAPAWKPRMSGAYCWAVAAESGLGLSEGEVERAFQANAREAATISFESSPFAQFVCDFVKPGTHWEGSAEALLNAARGARLNDRELLPKVARTVFDNLVRQKEALQQMGITVTKLPRQSGRRPIRITRELSWGDVL